MPIPGFVREVALAAALFVCACSDSAAPSSSNVADTTMVPLTDMTWQRYRGYAGGLYENGNTMPAAHLEAGTAHAKAIQPLDTAGRPSVDGRIVLLSIGMSNTTQEFCSPSANGAPCTSVSFTGQAMADPQVNHSTLVIANGAHGGHTTDYWTSPTLPDYDRVRDSVLRKLGVSERQVQIVWLKEANAQPTARLPGTDADAYRLEAQLGNVARALKSRYPNLQQLFVSSRIYGGYATSALNPEPYAYETGLAVKWLVQSQIDQAQGRSSSDQRAGDLRYDSAAPWLAWGPYLWAKGMSARSDGLVWTIDDFVTSDRTHPSQSGMQKVGAMLLSFFKGSPVTSCWFLSGRHC